MIHEPRSVTLNYIELYDLCKIVNEATFNKAEIRLIINKQRQMFSITDQPSLVWLWRLCQQDEIKNHVEVKIVPMTLIQIPGYTTLSCMVTVAELIDECILVPYAPDDNILEAHLSYLNNMLLDTMTLYVSKDFPTISSFVFDSNEPYLQFDVPYHQPNLEYSLGFTGTLVYQTMTRILRGG